MKIVSIAEMRSVMWDMMNADNWYRQTAMKDTLALKSKLNIQLYNKVFALHKITKTQFYSSLHYYETQPIKMKILLDSLDLFATRERLKKFAIK